MAAVFKAMTISGAILLVVLLLVVIITVVTVKRGTAAMDPDDK